MDMVVTDLEDVIDKEYSFDDVIGISSEGIRLKNDLIRFKDSMEHYRFNFERGIGERKYVGDRNCLTDPSYMKFTVDGEVIILLFPSRDDFYSMAEKIRRVGYETFDLS